MEDKKLKVLKGQIPVSIIYIALGVCLALMPVETVNVLCKVVFGLVLVGAGLYHIVIYVLEKENATILDLFSGVIVLVIGAFLFMNPQVVVKLLTLMLGAFILVDSIWMLRGSMKLRKRKLGAWKAFLIESLVFVALGVLILVNPFSEIRLTMQVSGWIFVANGALDIIFYLILRHGMKKEIPAEETEEKDDSKAETASAKKEEGKTAQNTEGTGNTSTLVSNAGNVSSQTSSEESCKNTEPAPEENAQNDGAVSQESVGNTEAVQTDASGENGEAEEVLEEWKD